MTFLRWCFLALLLQAAVPHADAQSNPLSLSANPSNAQGGQNVTLTATLSSMGFGTTVSFYDGAAIPANFLGTRNFVQQGSSKVASLSRNDFSAGTHTLRAVCCDNSEFAGYVATTTLIVTKVNTTTTLTSGPNPSFFGQNVTLDATVTPAQATGNVNFLDNGVVFASASLVNGKATLIVGPNTTGNFAVGNHPLSAAYPGDLTYNNSASPQTIQVVNPASSATLTSLNPSTAAAGSAAFTLTLNGTGFSQGAAATWNGTAITTTFVNAGVLTASVPASLIASTGTAQVRVSSGGGVTNLLPFTVNPAGQPCNFTFAPQSATFGSAGGPGSSQVTATRTDCTWTASANVPWITFPGGAITGSGNLPYNVQANPAGTSRSGKVTVGLQSFNVTQGGTACTFSLPSSSKSFNGNGGTGTAFVQAPPGCFWSSSNGGSSFVTIAAPGAASGNGSVNFTVAPNTTAAARTATLTIAGKPFTVNQGPAGSTISCTAAAVSVPLVEFEGLTEAAGGINIVCNGVTAPIKGDVILSLNTPVTNPLNGTINPLLSINGTTPAAGTVTGFNLIRYNGVMLNPINGTVNLAISQVCANANYLGTVANNQPLPLIGQVSIASLAVVPINSAPAITIATSSPALNFTKGQAIPPTGGARTLVPAVFTEAQTGGFLANTTRLRAVLTGLPATVQVFAPVFPSEGSNRARLFSADSNGAGGSAVNGSQVPEGLYQQLTVTGGTATATWQVLAGDNSQSETWTFPILVLNATTGDLNAIQIAGSLAPVSAVNVASFTAPVPRYRDTSIPTSLVNLRLSSTVTVLPPAAPAAPSLSMRALAAIAPKAADVGGRVTFTNTIVNDTSDPNQTATNVVIKDNLPTGLTLISCTATGASCGGSGNQVEVTIGTMGPGQTNTVTITAQVDPNLAGGSVLENPVNASSDQVNLDLDAANSSSSFIVVNGAPVAVGQTPASGSGSSQNFVFTFSHPSGFQQLGVVNVLINNFLDGRNACYLAYAIQPQSLFLIDDQGRAGGPFAGTAQLGSQEPIQNSQCSVVLAGALGSGNNLTLTLNVTFKPAFGGNKIVFVAARDQANANTDWQALGVWQVPFNSPGAIAVTGVDPGRSAGASGAAKQFRFTLSDSKGAGDLGIVNVLINNFIDGRKACYIAFNAANNNLFLVNDAGDAGGPFAGSMVINGPSASVENSQCLIGTAGSTVSFASGSITLTLNITFKPAFAGNKVFFVAGRDRQDGGNTDWQAVGTYSIQ